jgi:hypothetical protein
MIDYIKENITWIKELFAIIFTGTITIIAILTYRRAKATILQPIRTEVIKKQSEILTKLLQILKEHNHSFDPGLDYINLVKTNVLMTLRDYGFVFKDHEEIFNTVKDQISGWKICGRENILKDVEVIGVFKVQDEKSEITNPGIERYNKLKQGVIDIDKIYLTKAHSNYYKMISDYRNDPFMPSGIQVILNELVNDINNNLVIILKSELECFMIEFSKSYFVTNEAPKFNPTGVYNSFNHSRVHHTETSSRLYQEIRKYLRIDKKW